MRVCPRGSSPGGSYGHSFAQAISDLRCSRRRFAFGTLGGRHQTTGSNRESDVLLAQALHYCLVSGSVQSIDRLRGCLVAL